jgi:methionyl-tRNA formyltransferase
LDIAKIAPINVHGSLLPKYRGASPLQSVFLNQERQTGITIMKMDANMDTGNMIDMLKFDIEFDWTVKDLIEKIMQK